MPFLIHYGGLNTQTFKDRLKELGFKVDYIGGGVYLILPLDDLKDDRQFALERLASLPSEFIRRLRLSYVPDISLLEDEDGLIRSLIHMQTFDKVVEEFLLFQKDDILKSLYTVFQPIVDLRKFSLYAFEALCRGKVPIPYLVKFARPLLETIDWICREDAIRKKKEEGIPPEIKLFLNFFPDSLQDVEKASQKLFELLDKYGIAPNEIVVEITEYSGFDMEQLKKAVKRWRSLGIQIALDDVGRGEDSLFRFLEIIPDIIKIDKAFIKDIYKNKVKRDITRYLINLAHANNILVVAEGVEQEEDLKVVYELGADLVQGWLIGRETSNPREYLNKSIAEELKRYL